MSEAGAERVMRPRTPEEALFEQLDRQSNEGGGPLRLAGALLRAPGGLLRDLSGSQRMVEHALSLLAIAVAFCAAYGAVMGLYRPGLQTLYAALKIPIVVLGSALLCTPTLFVFNAVGGSRLTLAQVVCLVLSMTATISLILVAFAPIAWFFGVSTEGFGFMTFLHVVVFGTAAGFGLKAMETSRRYLRHLDGSDAIGPGLLLLWSVLLVLVGLQMAHHFRPIIVPGPFYLGERGLFLEAVLRLWR